MFSKTEETEERAERMHYCPKAGDAYLDVGRLSKVRRSPNMQRSFMCLTGAQWFSRSKSPPFPEGVCTGRRAGAGAGEQQWEIIIFLANV